MVRLRTFVTQQTVHVRDMNEIVAMLPLCGQGSMPLLNQLENTLHCRVQEFLQTQEWEMRLIGMGGREGRGLAGVKRS
jgi:hypothetical protein